MAITPLEDKSAIKSLIDTDSFITETLKFEPRNILVYDEVDEEVTGDIKYIFIVNYPSPPSPNGHSGTIVYGVECITHKTIQGNALRAMQRILELLDGADIGNNHILDIYEHITQLKAPKGTVRYGLSVKFETPLHSKKVSNKI